MLMKKLPSIQHVARVLRPTIDETEQALHELDEGSPPFSYNFSRSAALSLYQGKLTLAAALRACGKIKPELGAKCNREVVEVIWQDSQRASYNCFELRDRLYAIRKDLFIPVRPKFYLVRNGRPHVFWLQPWKTFDLTQEQLGVLASVIRDTYAIDDFEEADLYLLDASADDSGIRAPQVYSFDDLPLLDSGALKAACDRLAAAYDRFVTNRKPKVERPQKAPDPRQGKMFD